MVRSPSSSKQPASAVCSPSPKRCPFSSTFTPAAFSSNFPWHIGSDTTAARLPRGGRRWCHCDAPTGGLGYHECIGEILHVRLRCASKLRCTAFMRARFFVKTLHSLRPAISRGTSPQLFVDCRAAKHLPGQPRTREKKRKRKWAMEMENGKWKKRAGGIVIQS